jgi:xylose isomerase
MPMTGNDALLWQILPEKAAALKAQSFDRPAIAKRGLKYERLDQLTIDILTGNVR